MPFRGIVRSGNRARSRQFHREKKGRIRKRKLHRRPKAAATGSRRSIQRTSRSKRTFSSFRQPRYPDSLHISSETTYFFFGPFSGSLLVGAGAAVFCLAMICPEILS